MSTHRTPTLAEFREWERACEEDDRLYRLRLEGRLRPSEVAQAVRDGRIASAAAAALQREQYAELRDSHRRSQALWVAIHEVWP